MAASLYNWTSTSHKLCQLAGVGLSCYCYDNRDIVYDMSNLIEEQIMSSIWVEIADELLHP